jgi:multidrug efflux pump subunit AcrA (membrane-fusion protein)
MEEPMDKLPKKPLSPKDYEYIHSLSAAVLTHNPRRLRMVLYFWIAAIALFVIWAALAKVDEIARGDGQVVASGQNKMIQHLEGGIVEEILIEEGASVKANQPLLKVKNEKSFSSLESNQLNVDALRAKADASQSRSDRRIVRRGRIDLSGERTQPLYHEPPKSKRPNRGTP